ncbi:MAG: protein-L-isoaspartate O-methyltransferase family protein [Gammaproteobacteria bacterium]|jgi:protein-L-isoaspartate(D-aspartate) O-methyltransferase
MDFEQARLNMVEQQIRTWDVLDQTVLDSITAIPRDEFVPETYRNLAYSDTEIPLGYGEAMMTPKLEARLVQTLNLAPSDRVLEIGTGSGYLAALMAHNCAQVTTVELHAALLESASRRFEEHGMTNIDCVEGDGIDGWKAREPFEAIAITGSLAVARPGIERQLTIGGRLFMIVGSAPAMEALLVTRVGEDAFTTESLFETVLTPLVGGEGAPKFKF